jgi:peptidoglycan/LPS O-acetylase OafA/YrhL
MTDERVDHASGPSAASRGNARSLPNGISVYLDGVRFVAALCVVAAHLQLLGFVPAGISFGDLGHESVLVFFVMSGMVIAASADRPGATFGGFVFARAIRLYSVTVAALVVSYAFAIIAAAQGGAGVSAAIESTGGLTTLLSSLLFLNESWFSLRAVPWNDPYWSLCYEAWYYLVFGAWALLAGRARVVVGVAAALIAGPRILILMPIWGAGVALWRVWPRIRPAVPAGVALWVGSLAFLAAFDHFRVGEIIRDALKTQLPALWRLRYSEMFLGDAVLAIAVVVNFASIGMLPGGLPRALSRLSTAVRWLAGYTFSIYLFHYPLMLLASRTVKRASPSWLDTVGVGVGVVMLCMVLGQFTERRREQFARFARSAWRRGAAAARRIPQHLRAGGRHVTARSNNFDLIRLVSAANVMLLHCSDHLGVSLGWLRPLLEAVPGVPVFFVVSGFLITQAWDRSPEWPKYLRNRFLRIYPGLWVCFAVSVVAVCLSGFSWSAKPWSIVAWVIAQLTIGQFVTPAFMTGYGVGVLNGSLWTIPVELQFYLVLPILVAVGPVIRGMLIVVSVLCSIYVYDASAHLFGSVELPLKVTLLPNLYMFMIGVTVALHRDVVLPWLKGKVLLWGLAFALVIWFGNRFGATIGTNNPNPIVMVLLAAFVLSAAYTVPTFSQRLLRGNDVSYGIYIYHMVVVNALLSLGAPRFVWAVALSILCAIASWLLIERPALRNKAH